MKFWNILDKNHAEFLFIIPDYFGKDYYSILLINSMVDDDSYDDAKVFDLLFEPNNAEVLTRLKDGPKTLSYLSKILENSEEKLDEELSYLIEKGFISKIEKDGEVYYSANFEKLSKIMESKDNFKNIDNGLAELDSYLN